MCFVGQQTGGGAPRCVCVCVCRCTQARAAHLLTPAHPPPPPRPPRAGAVWQHGRPGWLRQQRAPQLVVGVPRAAVRAVQPLRHLPPDLRHLHGIRAAGGCWLGGEGLGGAREGLGEGAARPAGSGAAWHGCLPTPCRHSPALGTVRPTPGRLQSARGPSYTRTPSLPGQPRAPFQGPMAPPPGAYEEELQTARSTRSQNGGQ